MTSGIHASADASADQEGAVKRQSLEFSKAGDVLSNDESTDCCKRSERSEMTAGNEKHGVNFCDRVSSDGWEKAVHQYGGQQE